MIESAPFEMESNLRGDTGRLKMTGELDLASVPRVEEATRTLLARGARRVILDLSGLRFIDSSGLRMCIVLNDRASAEGWRLELIRPAGPAAGLFRVTRAEDSLPFVEDPEGS